MRLTKIFLMLMIFIYAVVSSGCTPTKAWLKKDYLDKTPAYTALDDINEYISRDSKNQLVFKHKEANPLVDIVYKNDAGVIMFFGQNLAGGIKSITLVYLNNDYAAAEAAKIITVQLCEIIAPVDYVFNFNNQQKLTLDHLQLDDNKLQLYEMAHNNNTRVEKLAENDMGIPITMIRFSKKNGDGLEKFGQNIIMKMLDYSNTELNQKIPQAPTAIAKTNKKERVPRQSGALGGMDLSLNMITIGNSQQDVLTSKGEPNSKKYVNERLRWKYDDMEIVFDGDIVSALVTENSSAITPRDIAEGSLFTDVVAAYGNDYYKTSYEDLILYEYTIVSLNGRECLLRFAVKNDKVNYISMRYAN